MPNAIRTQTENFWFSHQARIGTAAYLYVNNIDRNPLREILAARFEDGAKWSMVETTRLNPYVSQFIEMLILLGVFDNARMAEEASAETSGDPCEYVQPDLPSMRGDISVSPALSRDDANTVRQLQHGRDDWQKAQQAQGVTFCDYVYMNLEGIEANRSKLPRHVQKQLDNGEFVHTVDPCILLAGHSGEHHLSSSIQPTNAEIAFDIDNYADMDD